MFWLVPAALAGTVFAIGAPVATPQVWVQVASTLDCPPPSSLLVALRARLGAARVLTGDVPNGSLVLRVEPHGRHGISAVLEQAGVRIVHRTIDVDVDECAGLAETVALVTETWLPAPPPAASDAAPSGSAAKSTTQPPEASALDAALGEANEPPSSPPSSATMPLPQPQPAPHANPAIDRPQVAGNGSATRGGWAIEAALGSSFALDVAASTVALLRIGAELGIEPWRVGVRGQVETAGSLDSTDISIRHSSIEAVIGADLYQRGTIALATSLAAGADLLGVDASSYTDSAPAHLVEPIAALGLRCEWRAFESLGLTLGAESALSLRRERFVSDLDPVVHTPRIRAKISIGALWHPF